MAATQANLHDVHTLEKNQKRLVVLGKAMDHAVAEQIGALKKAAKIMSAYDHGKFFEGGPDTFRLGEQVG